MKKISMFLVLFLFVAMTAYAHPPSDIQITFDPATKVLQAVLTHEVNDAAKHFLKKIDVGLNGQEIISHQISRQDNNQTQTVSYLIPDAQAGDTISVEGYCNLNGDWEKEITVP
jgi:desulfoferrodoxin (superoxide reductase-like protein)